MNFIQQSYKKYKKNIFEYLLVLFAGILATGFVFRSLHPTIPMSYAVDEVMFTAIFKVMLETGTPFPWYENNSYGAPLGTNLLDYPNIDNLHYSLVYPLLLVFKNAVVTYNLFFILTFILTTITAYYVLRKLDIPFIIALPGALSYTFIPYHIMRGSHITLAGYYMVPLIILLAYLVDSGKITLFNPSSRGKLLPMRPDWKERTFWLAVILCLLFGFAGVYSAFFAVYMILLLGLKSLVLKRYPAAVSHAFIAGMIGFSVLINMAPPILNILENGPTAISVGNRGPQQSEVYGLKLIQMLLPSPVHGVDSLRELNDSYRDAFPNVNENQTSALGLFGSVGFLLALIFLFTRQREDPLINFLGFSNLVCFLLGTVGGFGALFAFFVSPIIRSYNRISVFIAFFAIATLSLAVKELYIRFAPLQKGLFFKSAILIVLTGVVFFDQIWIEFPYNQQAFTENFVSDRDFVKELENQLPDGAMIFQLPFMSYPESPRPHKMKHYDHLKVYLHSEDLRWSYGSMIGSVSSEWNRRIAGLPVEEMVTALAVSDFAGIQINRDGYPNPDWWELEANLTDILKVRPVISQDIKLVFFDLGPYKAELRERISEAEWESLAAFYGFTTIYSGGFLEPDENGGYALPCDGQQGMLTLANVNKEMDITVSFEAQLTGGGEAHLKITGGEWEESLALSDTPVSVVHAVQISSEPLQILLSCNPAGSLAVGDEQPEGAVRIGNIQYK